MTPSCLTLSHMCASLSFKFPGHRNGQVYGRERRCLSLIRVCVFCLSVCVGGGGCVRWENRSHDCDKNHFRFVILFPMPIKQPELDSQDILPLRKSWKYVLLGSQDLQEGFCRGKIHCRGRSPAQFGLPPQKASVVILLRILGLVGGRTSLCWKVKTGREPQNCLGGSRYASV